MAISILGCGVLLLALVGLIPLVITYLSLRKSDPEHALRRSAGMGLMVLGGLAFAGGFAAFLMALLPSQGPVFQSYWTPSSSGSSSYHIPRLDPSALSVWLVVAGAAIGCGWFLVARQFSLRSLMIGLILVAAIASIPQFVIHQHDVVTLIEVHTDLLLTAEEWSVVQKALSKESLCKAVTDPVQKSLPCPVTDAVKRVELEVHTKAGENGVTLTVSFAPELGHEQIGSIFDELTEYVRNAVPKEEAP